MVDRHFHYDLCYCGHERKYHVEAYECCGGECERGGGRMICIECYSVGQDENHDFVFDNLRWVEDHAKND